MSELDDVKKDLIEVMKKHGLSGASFCATQGDNFMGLFCMGDENNWQDAACNVGRLWQHSRNAVRAVLDRYEGAWGK